MADLRALDNVAADNGLQAGGSGLSQAKTGALSREIAPTGTAEPTEQTVTITKQAEEYGFTFQTDDASSQHDGQDPDSTWTVKLNVTTTNGDLDWSSTYIYERTSGGTYNLIGSLTGQTTDIGTSGVAQHQVTGSLGRVLGTDITVVIVLGFTATSLHNDEAMGITLDQTDTVITPYTLTIS
ncbi:MAG: hypothetical protein ACYSVY_17045, partial [Planctomycetota bacterium]